MIRKIWNSKASTSGVSREDLPLAARIVLGDGAGGSMRRLQVYLLFVTTSLVLILFVLVAAIAAQFTSVSISTRLFFAGIIVVSITGAIYNFRLGRKYWRAIVMLRQRLQ